MLFNGGHSWIRHLVTALPDRPLATTARHASDRALVALQAQLSEPRDSEIAAAVVDPQQSHRWGYAQTLDG